MKITLLLCLCLIVSASNGQYSITKTEYNESKIREYLDSNETDEIEAIYKYVEDNSTFIRSIQQIIMEVDIYEYTNKGRRAENQDSFGYKKLDHAIIACIADGVGGVSGGKIASQYSVDKYLEQVTNINDNLNIVIEDIHSSIVKLQRKEIQYDRMATTFTGCVVSKNKIKGVHLGDCKLYILRRDGIKQFTRSHTEVNRLLRTGKLTKEEAENYPRKKVLESAIGMKDKITIHDFEFDLEQYDRILLTTDGVHDVVSKIEFRDLSKKNKNINGFGDELVTLLKDKPTSDNFTFLIIEITK